MTSINKAIRDQLKVFCEDCCHVNFLLDMAGSDDEKAAVIDTYCGDNCNARQFMERLVGDNDVEAGKVGKIDQRT